MLCIDDGRWLVFVDHVEANMAVDDPRILGSLASWVGVKPPYVTMGVNPAPPVLYLVISGNSGYKRSP